VSVLLTMFSVFRSAAALQAENLALRHQIAVLRRSAKKRPKLTVADRVFWAWLSGAWADWRSALVIVKPATLIGGQRRIWIADRESVKVVPTCRRSHEVHDGTGKGDSFDSLIAHEFDRHRSRAGSQVGVRLSGRVRIRKRAGAERFRMIRA
jgi:hypothetical protein